MTITTRSRIEVRWTTSPALVGYANSVEQRDEQLEDLMNSPAAFVGTPRQVLEYRRTIKAQIGGSTYSSWWFAHKGREVALSDIEQVEQERQFQTLNKKR